MKTTKDVGRAPDCQYYCTPRSTEPDARIGMENKYSMSPRTPYSLSTDSKPGIPILTWRDPGHHVACVVSDMKALLFFDPHHGRPRTFDHSD
jgi:hypothetical protein